MQLIAKSCHYGCKNTEKNEVLEAVEYLRDVEGILVAEPNYFYESHSDWVPNDVSYSKQWGLQGTYGINVEKAWDITRGANVKVGIFESGIDSNHEDLKGRVGQGNLSSTFEGDLSHGTHVGGIISAVTNDKGIAGISQATLHLLDTRTFAESLMYAIDNNIRIINASFHYTRLENGLRIPALPDPSHVQAIENYGNNGGLLICSAGNDGNNSDDFPQYPAGYGDKRKFPNIKNIISVGSIDNNGKRSSFSNFGINSVDIYAPGSDIYSTLPNNNYGNASGTSMAAPHVTGAAALLLSYVPDISVDELKRSLIEKADDITIEGNSAKLLNIGSALWSRAYPNWIEVRNMGHFAIGGGCNGNISGWNIEVTNNSNTTMRVVYNKRMCNEGDAKEWTGLSDIDSFDLTAGTSFVVKVEENGFATHIAFSYVVGNNRSITYANELDSKRNMINPQVSNTNYKTYECINLVGKSGGVWIVDVKNIFNQSRRLVYNEKMCNFDDAKNWTGLNDLNDTKILESGETTTIRIVENVFATTIAISFVNESENWRNIYYADNLNVNCTMTIHTNSISSTQKDDNCVAAGTLITLADGSKKAVEELTGDEMLLVWNFFTGSFDAAPILFVDNDSTDCYEVIKLSFSDGTIVDVISEHGFWDVTLNKYVYLDMNAAQYIGHAFLKQDQNDMMAAVLTNVEIQNIVTTAWSPVTCEHLCYYVNGMLSMPGGITGFFNIFEVGAETLTIDKDAFASDIENYELFTYEEFCEMFSISEEIFDALNGRYLKVSMGKGLITDKQISKLIKRYSIFWEHKK